MIRLLAAVFLAGPLLMGASALAESDAERTSVYQVEGMTCALCPKAIEKSLNELDGVQSVDVDRKAERVTVVADAAIPSDRLEQAIESAGNFQAKPIP